MILFFIFPWVFSVIGLLLVISSCFWARSPRAYFLALVGGILLHLLAAAISSQPFGSFEPSHQEFYDAHDFAVFYFWDGLPFIIVPLLIRFLYVYIRSHRKSA
jgi:hypothetical protein